eukprot:s818_g8.t1
MEPTTARIPRKLVLHFDVNETIMVGDPAAGIDFGASLNNIIAKAAFISKTGKLGFFIISASDPSQRSDSSPPPLVTGFEVPKDCDRCFFRLRDDPTWPSSRLTEPETPGAVYRPLYEQLAEALRWKHEPNEVFAAGGHHFLLPAFFHMLSELEKQGRDFSVVIRTFGTDIPEVAKSVAGFAEGLHPDFPMQTARLRSIVQQSGWAVRRKDRSDPTSPILFLDTEPIGSSGFGKDLTTPEKLKYTEEIHGSHQQDFAGASCGVPPNFHRIVESSIPDFLTAGPAACVRDDYFYWKGNHYRPESGKPVWLTLEEENDNIHNDPDDSIVGIRVRQSASDSFRHLSGEVTRRLEGVFLVKAQPVDAILDPDCFLRSGAPIVPSERDACPGSVCVQSCAGNVTVLAPTEDPTSTTGTFPATLVYVPASIVFMLLCCGGLLVYRCLKRSGFFSRIPSPSLPNPVLIRRREPPPSSALAQRLEEATNRALYGPADEAATGELRLPASWLALDPGRNKTKDLPISRLWETWEEEEHKYLGTSAAEQAQLVGKSGLADGRSSWSRRLPTTLQKNGQASAAVPWSSFEDRRLIPPMRKPVVPTKMPSDGESEDIEAPEDEAEELTPKSPAPVTAPLTAIAEELQRAPIAVTSLV